jgi:type II secretory pathway predicted ATPase ExeA
MIRLRQLLIDCGVSQKAFSEELGHSYVYIRNVLIKGILPLLPKKRTEFIQNINAWVESDPRALKWLEENNLPPSSVWQKDENQEGYYRKKAVNMHAMIPGDPLIINPRKDIEMILVSTMKHFKLFKNPFLNDVTSRKDIYLSAEHRFLKEMMLDAAKYGGFVAVVGGVGSGKSIMRKAVAEQLMSDGIKVVFPLIIDKSRVSPSSLIDAIIMDISDEVPKRSLEQKTRQAVRLLKARSENSMRQVLMIEEAHTIDKRAFKALKQIYELEAGFEKLVGIILIGQPELLKKLDEVGNADIREVIRRITTAEIEGLGKDVQPYLELKFTRVGKKVTEVFDNDVYEAINKRLERVRGRKTMNRSFPLSVNNLVSRGMNMAAQMGEVKVTADLIMNC